MDHAILLCGLVISALAGGVQAGAWTAFRGPNGGSTSLGEILIGNRNLP